MYDICIKLAEFDDALYVFGDVKFCFFFFITRFDTACEHAARHVWILQDDITKLMVFVWFYEYRKQQTDFKKFFDLEAFNLQKTCLYFYIQ